MEDQTNPGCPHRWVLAEEEGGSPTKIKCVLCEGTRDLTPEDVSNIQKAVAAGVVFLHWPQKVPPHAGPRPAKSPNGGVTQSKPSAVRITAEVPAGFIPVAEAAAKLGIEAKKLRKQCREGRREGLKIGGNIYVKVVVPDGTKAQS